MEKNDKIYVAGHLGLVGSAIWKNLLSKGYSNLCKHAACYRVASATSRSSLTLKKA